MRIIGVIASPHKVGNTAWTVNKILEGARDQGAETESWYFSDLDISPCRGCWACKDGDKGCAINDDMQKLYDTIITADAIILGSPVYMGQMTAQAKTFTDRLFACSSPRFSPYFKDITAKKKMVLVFTQGNPDADRFRVYYDYTKSMFQILEFDVKELYVVTGMREKPASERTDLHAAMKGIGSALVTV